MPVRQSYHPVLRTAVLAVSLTIAACDSGDSPVAPDAAEPLAPESAAAAPAADPVLVLALGGNRHLPHESGWHQRRPRDQLLG
jgi:hypothetical protein